MSLASWALINVVLRLLFRRHHDIERFERETAQNQAAGPARPCLRLRRRLEVSATMIGAVDCLRVKARGTNPVRRVVYFHGGAYVREMVRPQWTLIAGIAETVGAEVIVPNYGLAPRHTASQTVPKLLDVVSRLREESALPVALTGDSAGGGLALALTHLLRDNSQHMPIALVLLYPWLDVTLSDPAQQEELSKIDLTLSGALLRHAGRLWAGSLEPTDPLVSPLFGDQQRLPPTLALGGGADLLVPDCRRFAQLCPSAVVHEYPDMFHGWICVGTPEGKAALNEATSFLKVQFEHAEREMVSIRANRNT